MLTKIGHTELAEVLGQPLDIIARLEITNTIVAAVRGVVLIEAVLVRAVPQDLQYPEVLPIEVQEVVPEVVVRTEVQAVVLGVQHQEAVVIDQVVEVQEQEVVEVTEVLEAAQEAQVVAIGVQADLQDHHPLADLLRAAGLHLVAGLLLAVGLQAEVVDVVIDSSIIQ